MTVAIVEIKMIVEEWVASRVLDPSSDEEEVRLAVAIHVDESDIHVVGFACLGRGLVGSECELSVGLAQVERASLAGCTGDENVIDPIAVHVGDG
jgi:hypothetical protein